MNNNIVEIDGEDLISESMHKINQNFHTLSQMNEQSEYGWGRYVESVKEEIRTLKNHIDSKNIEISRQIELVDNKFDDLPTINNLQQQVANALANVDSVLGNEIRALAGQQVGIVMGDYAKTSDVARDYVSSNSFELYQSDSKNKQASANIIVANSKFYTKYNDTKGCDCLVLLENGNVSNYVNIKDFYYNGLTSAENSRIDPNNKGLSDPDVLNSFIALCETKFKTVSTEMVGFSAKIEEDIAKMDIVAQVEGTDGKNKVAAIFTEANKSGSGITLNADHLNLTGETLVVDTSNFKVNKNGDGKVEIKGEIEATKLIITGSATSDFSNLVQSAGNGVWAQVSSLSDYVQNTVFNSTLGNYTTTSALTSTLTNYPTNSDLSSALSEYATKSEVSAAEYNDGWLTGAFNKTLIEGGLALTGNIFVADSNSNITAGMMGANTSGSDLRFFAGSSSYANSLSAPFRVYEDGTFYATNAHITGEITATSLTIASDASSAFNTLVQGAVSNAGYINTSTLTSALSNYTTASVLTSALSNYTTATDLGYALSNYTTATDLGYALENYATKSDLSSVASYPDGWLTRAFSKTAINGGLVLTGNVFAADSNSNVTAGMMGGSTSGNDLRFFAGSSDVSIAPFRVYEDGSFYAEKAHLSGVIKYNFLRITQNNWENYKRKLGEKNGVPYYTINLNNTGKNVEIAYLPFVPGGIGLTFDVNTPTITEDMVGTEINIINLIPKSTITIGHNFRDFTVEGYPYTNAAIIKPDNSQSSGFVGGNTTGRVGFLECMTLMAIEIPTYEPESSYNICNACGYNNGGLFTGGVCPDCGSTNIRTETRGGGTRFAWIRTDKYIT